MSDKDFDVFRVFKKCFFCKGRKNLKRVVHPGYEVTFTYYHQDCLEKVVANASSYPGFVDSAIQITDRIREDNELKSQNRQRLQQSIETLNSITNITNLIRNARNENVGIGTSLEITLFTSEQVMAQVKAEPKNIKQDELTLEKKDIIFNNKMKNMFKEEKKS